MMSKYRGITHARGFNKLTYWLWRKLKCNRVDVHLFDEVQTAGNPDGMNHYLVCDACELEVGISRISTKWVKK